MPDEFDEEKFKRLLITDLLIYFIKIFIDSNPNKGEIISTIINKWSDFVDEDADILKAKYAKTIANAGEQDMTEDVAAILLEVKNVERTMAKKEFKDNILKTLLSKVE